MTSCPDHYYRRRRRDCHVTTTFVIIVFMLTVDSVASEHLSSSEDSRGIFSKRNRAIGIGHGGGGGEGGVGFISDWNTEWGNLGNPNSGKCVDVPSNLTLCGNIGYDQMRLPNLLEHDTLREVSQQASSWVRLVAVRCHPDTQVFLCSLFAPVCLDRPVWPCRSLCESVKTGCEDRMLKYGFPWPEMLRCSQFPTEDDLCIGLRSDSHKDSELSCPACQSFTFEATVDHYCRAEFVMRVKVKQAIVTGSDLKVDIEKKRRKVFKTGLLRSSASLLRGPSMFVARGSDCDCATLDGATGGRGRNSSSFVVMGRTIDHRLVLSFVHRIDRSSKEIKRALKAARKPDFCSARNNGHVDAKSGPTTTSKEEEETKKTGAPAAKAGNKGERRRSSRGREAMVKGTLAAHGWKTTTEKSTETSMVAGRQGSYSGESTKKQQKRKTTEAPEPQQFY